MKKSLKWIVGIILTPFLLFITLTILLYIPAVQNWAVKCVADYASEKTGISISVDRVRLVFPLDLGVEGFRMIQPNDSLPQVKDTVADVGRLVVDVRLMPLLSKKVEIDALEFNNMKLNTADFVHEARVKGSIRRLYVRSHGIDLGDETVRVDDAVLKDATVSVELSDTVPPDTTKTENRWKISVDRLKIAQTAVTVHTPGDTLQIEAYLGKTKASGGFFDLYKGIYKVNKFDWKEGGVKYDNKFKTRTKGLDPNHIALSDVNIGIDTLYYCTPKLSMNLRECSFKEKSGIIVESLTGNVALDSTKVSLPNVAMRTPDSYLTANVIMDLDAFSDKNPGKLHLTADASLGKQDIMRFLGGMPSAFIRKWPNRPLTVKAVATGNMKHLKLAGVSVKLPTAFNISARGFAANLTDMERMRADIKLDAKTYDLGFVKALAGGGSFNIPQGIGLNGRFRAEGKRYFADFTATEGGGSVKAKADVNIKTMAYKASMAINSLKIKHFMPSLEAGPFTGDVTVKGAGTDYTSAKTTLWAKAGIHKFNYGRHNLDGVTFDADMNKGRLQAFVNSNNPLLKGTITLDALLSKKKISTTFIADLRHADWYGMGFAKAPLATSFCCHIDAATDRQSMINVKGMISDLAIVDSGRVFRPDDIVIDVLTTRDTTHLVTQCGDFMLRFNGKGGYKRILSQAENFQKELLAALKDRQINVSTLRHSLPLAELYLSTGKENPLSRFIARAGYTFKDARIDLTSSPMMGLNGNVLLTDLQNSSMQLDTIRFEILSDSIQCNYHGQVRNNSDNPQYVFNALLDGYVFEKGSGATVSFYDAKDSLGLNLGAEASLEDNGMKIHISTDDPIIGYKKFNVNEDNYLFLGRDKRLSANLLLRADDGTGFHVYTNDENTEALQDLTIGLHRFDLSKILTVIPYMPKITGTMNGDFHLIQTPTELSLSSTLSVDSMTYENTRMGNIGSEFVYMPKSDGTHVVDGTLMCNNEQIANVNGSYRSEDGGQLDVNMELDHMPMRLLNGFIPDRMVRFRGYADGSMAVKGTLDKPLANGELTLDSCYMRSPRYGMNLRLSEEPIRIVGSNLLLENFKAYSTNKNQLALNGNIDFSDLNNMNMDLRMAARNFQIIDSKERRRSIAFGKAFVDVFATMRGPFNNLKLLGRLDVLGTTDMSYILRDSPLSTDNQMDELVKFTNFNDTTATVVKHPPLSGFSMDMTLGITKGARIMCYLNDSHSNYIDLMGGGDLRMVYNAAGDLSLTGKYTLENGEMKFSLPVIPLKTFTIQDGSYIEFNGNPMNPRLNITATEDTKANVSSANGQTRTVEFTCGVVITRTLSDMGLEFILDAPQDMTLHNELQAMGVEQRGKLAVTMLTTGMYLADGNTGGFSMNSALSSFLQSEINNITGNALRTLDLSFGMGNTTDASGNTHTDYSFKFAKRFWNNRLKIVVGGKVSTGADAPNMDESFFDNVTFEYRIGSSGDKYLKLFYDNNAYDWLEGTTREYGVGFIWRRSLQNLKEIFSFKKKSNFPTAPQDSTKGNSKK